MGDTFTDQVGIGKLFCWVRSDVLCVLNYCVFGWVEGIGVSGRRLGEARDAIFLIVFPVPCQTGSWNEFHFYEGI